MRHSRYAVLLVLLLAWIPDSPEVFAQQSDTATAAQEESQEGEVRGVALEQNYPNPFRRDTRIPFVLGEGLFEDGTSVVVSVRIYNVLGQLVSIPTALDHPSAAGQPALELRYDRPGRYLLYWDGTDQSGRRVNSGIYFCRITANRAQDLLKIAVSR
ncbi:MAG: T9SS type A sorting domain-containing protein [Gemmatimonadetes bacterium]|uniref:T9SS type A sorting domain-containing protein n=1 Tax=Candidatus Kutchimonas denitrificans TaxID=3056748 RepID=A0AAE5CCC3_9BACT|nr:T9SS type A sorting domain-containing protein [Gemmatimonadota bacterium]NIR75708.1 T9SS type A sorting domain-containing protein [Candidatus Kutchimonas denitrificans]NIS00321.1 T9SS type A sorting domain-containing protein [Gemmatimonadota bacterium]NIT65980.1 T9SS type A sorting domain-containing protein [Gemmatimonadota bacterium]NIU53684.1 hypothetical protein [Gemmatimonadota bacterium]